MKLTNQPFKSECWSNNIFWVFILTMRNWNFIIKRIIGKLEHCFYLNYEELKLDTETSKSPRWWCFYLNYEELKLDGSRTRSTWRHFVFILTMRNWNNELKSFVNSITIVFILTMRNWNPLPSSAFHIPWKCFYLNYEELKLQTSCHPVEATVWVFILTMRNWNYF